MSEWLDSTLHSTHRAPRRFAGVTAATVVDNVDQTGRGRVQIQIAWHAGVQPWARVAVLAAGPSRGTYFIPQVGDEVLVAFENGELTSPYIVGALWNGQDRPPASSPEDARNKQIIRTRTGHEIQIDDDAGSITITSAGGQKLVLDDDKVEATAGDGAARLTLETSGRITLRASQAITLDAPNVAVRASDVDVQGSHSASLHGGERCSIQATRVLINS